MKINRLVIENFKSIERIELIEPNPFTVFVGPNGSGKSNIFEALEFVNLVEQTPYVFSLFGRQSGLLPKQNPTSLFRCEMSTGRLGSDVRVDITSSDIFGSFSHSLQEELAESPVIDKEQNPDYKQLYRNYSRIFIANNKLVKLKLNGEDRLSLSADNLEKVLKRILANPVLRNEIFEYLELFVPGFKAVEVDDRDELHWFENSSSAYFTKDLISDGTYNILALLTAVYQSDDKPQFLCIEEPENGLHPQVIAEFVNLCRYACEEFGHFIWLNTHSESLVRKLKTEEIVLVDKRNGATQIKQVKDMNLYDLPMDEAWLSSALGGGTPW